MKRQKKEVWNDTEKGGVKRYIIQSKKKVNEQFGKGKRKLFWKEVSNVKGGELQ